MNKILCIYHGNCADGFAAALVVRMTLGKENVEFFHAAYDKPGPDVTGRDVIMVDFSYKRPALEKMITVARSVLILDHHKTAAEDLAWLTPAVEWATHKLLLEGYWEAIVPSAVFDMNRSGAGLTWDYFNPNKPRPPLIDHIEDRDLWRFELAGTREIQAALFSYPYDFDVWEFLLDQCSNLREEGVAIERKHFKDIRELIEVGRERMIIAGHDVPVCNLPYTMSSDAGHIMGVGEKFAACYMDTKTGRVFSLRSAPDGMDVGAIASLFGGGGHVHAAGFTVPHGTDVSKVGLSTMKMEKIDG